MPVFMTTFPTLATYIHFLQYGFTEYAKNRDSALGIILICWTSGADTLLNDLSIAEIIKFESKLEKLCEKV